jgi:hypothetical protein
LQLDRSGAVLRRIERPWTAGIWSRVYQTLRLTFGRALVDYSRSLVLPRSHRT